MWIIKYIVCVVNITLVVCLVQFQTFQQLWLSFFKKYHILLYIVFKSIKIMHTMFFSSSFNESMLTLREIWAEMKSAILILWTINEIYKVSIIWFMTTNNILVQSPSCTFIWNSDVLLKYRHVNYLSPINNSHMLWKL